MSLDRSVSLDQPAIPVLLSDPRVRRIGVLECGEPLVDVRRFPRVVVDTRMSDPEGAWAFVRVGVLDRLLRAADALPAGIRLVLVEGYRPMSLQRTSFIEYLDELTDALPDLDGDAAWMQASAYVSPPEIAPHCAGAAVDVTLIDSTGAELDMGTRVNASPLESHGRCTTDAFGLTPEQRRNRALLRAVLEQAGFVNYPALWWHYSYGDCYWALATGRAAALYGRIESPWAASTA
ncbi:MAG: M15 family metallopeptidase [Actinomycetes bacterium]